MLGLRLPKQNPQARGALGGSCLESRPLRRVWDVGGWGHALEQYDVSGTASRAAIALWWNGIAPWYAAVLPGRPVLARQAPFHPRWSLLNLRVAPFGLGNAALIYRTLCRPSAIVKCLRRNGTRPLHKIVGRRRLYNAPEAASVSGLFHSLTLALIRRAACSAGSSRHRTLPAAIRIPKARPAPWR
jgi:hypothetical protein